MWAKHEPDNANRSVESLESRLKYQNDSKLENGHTSNVTDPGTAKDANELARRASVITDGDHVAQCTGVVVNDLVKRIYQTIGSTAAREDHDLASWGCSHAPRFQSVTRDIDQSNRT